VLIRALVEVMKGRKTKKNGRMGGFGQTLVMGKRKKRRKGFSG
jgi:hypothetical protein